MNGKINLLLNKFKNLLLRNKKTVIAITLVIFLYFFVLIIFKVSSAVPKKPPAQKKYSYLSLEEFIGGYRTYQEDFEVEKIRFGEKFLSFTLKVKSKAKTELVIRKLAIDIILGLRDEYPELNSIDIEVLRDSGAGSVVVYGRAIYASDNDRISWQFR